MDRDHPVAEVMEAAARGRFPAVDGVAEVLPPDHAGTHAVVDFTGHSFILTDLHATQLARFGPNGFGAATQPQLLTHLAGANGVIGTVDVVMVARRSRTDSLPLPPRADLDDHPRVQRARRHRGHVVVYGDERGLACIGTGLVGRTEISIELTGVAPARGFGRDVLRAALQHVPDGEFVFAQVSPGNAASVRMFLACGFVPIGGEVIIEPDRA
jgi:hypothetical protein